MATDTLITLVDLQNRQLLQNLQEHYTQTVLKFDDVREASWFIHHFQKVIDEKLTSLMAGDQDLAQSWQILLSKNKLIGFEFLSEGEIVQLFTGQGAALFSLPENINVWRKIRAILLARYDYEERDQFKAKLRQALEECAGNLTKEEIVIGNEWQQPSVQNWLRDYRAVIGASSGDALKQAQYFTASQNTKHLGDEERERVRRLIRIYEQLQLSSLTAFGLEDPVGTEVDGKPVTLRDGEFQEIDPRVVRLLFELKEKGIFDGEIPDSMTKGVPGVVRPTMVQPINESSTITQTATATRVQSVLPQVPVSQLAILPIIPITSVAQALKSDKPALIFDMEDEKEADRFRIKNQESGIKHGEVLEKQIRTFINEVVGEKNLVFKDEVNQRRFVQLMVSRLKDVRGPLEVAEALRKPIEAGGLGMPDEKADQVQRIVEEAKKEFGKKVNSQQLIAEEEEVEMPQPSKSVVTPTKPAKPAFDAEASRIWREQMLREIQAQGKSGPDATGQVSSPQLAIPRPQLVDVKAPPKVVGPLEELRSLTLVDFRRLGATPQEALQKIGGKIDLLGETSIGRKLEAVKAWKSSVVYQQYLRLGRESIEQGKPVSVIAGSHQTLGEPVLSEDEFTSIADFNAKLRF